MAEQVGSARARLSQGQEFMAWPLPGPPSSSWPADHGVLEMNCIRMERTRKEEALTLSRMEAVSSLLARE